MAKSKPVTDSPRAEVKIVVERTIYPLEAIFGAAYIFLDRCYVFLDAPDATHVTVQLRARGPMSKAELAALGGEFENELLAQAWRHAIVEKHRDQLADITTRALAGALGAPPLPDVNADDFDDLDGAEAFDDPLGIAVPWEEKYGKAASETAAAVPGPSATAPASDLTADARKK